jgi:putative membrane protein
MFSYDGYSIFPMFVSAGLDQNDQHLRNGSAIAVHIRRIKMSKQLILKRMAACATLALLFGGAIAQNTTASPATGSAAAVSAAAKVGSGDQKMMQDISHANHAEVAAGKLALDKSQSDDVKVFAQKMIDDHSKAQQELQLLAESKGVMLPAEPDTKHKAMAKMLSGLKGEAFDKRYLKQGGLDDHQAAHKLLERVQTQAKDADLKAYAAKTVTAVELHLAMAQEIAGKHGVSNPRAAMKNATSDPGTGGTPAR